VDACLEIWIPKLRLGLSLSRLVRNVSWGDEEFVEDLGKWTSADGVEVKETGVPPQVMSRLPLGFPPAGWSYLRVEGPALDAASMPGESSDESWAALERVLAEQMPAGEPWVLVFEPHCDQIDLTAEMSPSEGLALLKRGVRREEGAPGFVVYSRGR
jgi:hypothetical protein